MDVTAQLSSKGQLTIPKAVRDALGLVEGDQVVFRVDGQWALLARTPKLLDLAGSVAVPAQKPLDSSPNRALLAPLIRGSTAQPPAGSGLRNAKFRP
jgi:antitoxin PrlF